MLQASMGFDLSFAISPSGFEDMIKYLCPKLRKRGVSWDDEENIGASMRENGQGPKLREGHPSVGYKRTWTFSS